MIELIIGYKLCSAIHLYMTTFISNHITYLQGILENSASRPILYFEILVY